jgi:hypothetical protein
MKAALFSFAATIAMMAGSLLLQGSANPARQGDESSSRPAAGYTCPSLHGDPLSRCPYLDSQADALQDDPASPDDDPEYEEPETRCPYLHEQGTPETRQESNQNLQLFRMI